MGLLRFQDALKDFKEILKHEPTNFEAQTIVNQMETQNPPHKRNVIEIDNEY